MASTEQIRKWFHSGVVLNHADRGKTGYHPHCDHNHPKVAFPRAGGGVFNEPVHPLTFEAFTAYVAVMRHHGETMPGAGGVDQCRNIGTGNWPSLHAYICAVDLPLNSRKSAAFIASIKAIRTNSGARFFPSRGAQVFRNLRGDRMHDQINCSPKALATGIDWSTVDGNEGDDMAVSSWAQDSWDWAKARFSWSAGPTDTVTVEQLMVFLKRYDASVVGSKGDTGPRGFRGAQGVAGQDGKSASLTIIGDQTLP